MKITEHECPFPYMVIEDLFKPKDWEEIVFELEWFRSGRIFEEAENTGAAKDLSGKLISSKTGFFLEKMYKDASLSKIHKHIHNIIPYLFSETNVWYFNQLKMFDLSTSPLVSYYENTDYYKPHVDQSLYTFLFWHFDEPKSFGGGDLIFTDYGIELECRPNFGVIFPGPIRHEVTEITNCVQGKGRFAVSTFFAPPKFPENQ